MNPLFKISHYLTLKYATNYLRHHLTLKLQSSPTKVLPVSTAFAKSKSGITLSHKLRTRFAADTA